MMRRCVLLLALLAGLPFLAAGADAQSVQGFACQADSRAELPALLLSTREKVRRQAGFCADVSIADIDMSAFTGEETKDQAPLDVGQVALRPSDGTFSVTLTRPDKSGEPVAARVVRGRYYQAQPVIVSERRLDPGEVIGEDDVSVVFVAPESVPTRSAVRLDEVVGMSARWSIPARTIVTAAQLEPNFIVRKGNRLTALFQGRNVALSAEAVAAENGAPGQVIALKNLASNRVFQGRVRDSNTVVVE